MGNYADEVNLIAEMLQWKAFAANEKFRADAISLQCVTVPDAG